MDLDGLDAIGIMLMIGTLGDLDGCCVRVWIAISMVIGIRIGIVMGWAGLQL